MSTTNSFVAIKEEALAKAPVAIQAFVKEYFEQTVIFGIPCWAGYESLHGDNMVKGVAPCHSLELRGFEQALENSGLPEGQDLYDAFNKFKKAKSRCFCFSRTFDDGRPVMWAD